MSQTGYSQYSSRSVAVNKLGRIFYSAGWAKSAEAKVLYVAMLAASDKHGFIEGCEGYVRNMADLSQEQFDAAIAEINAAHTKPILVKKDNRWYFTDLRPLDLLLFARDGADSVYLKASSGRKRAELLGLQAESNTVIRKHLAGLPNVCHWCGMKLSTKWDADHVIPLSKGGTHTTTNIVKACSSCNRKKSNKLLQGEAQWKPTSEALA